MEEGQIVEMGPVLEVFRRPQQKMTKEFVKQITEPEETVEAIATLASEPNSRMVQLTFVGEETESPLITELIRAFDIEVNIVQGKITKIQNGSYGTLFVALKGEEHIINDAIAFIKEKKVDVEVIKNDQ